MEQYNGSFNRLHREAKSKWGEKQQNKIRKIKVEEETDVEWTVSDVTLFAVCERDVIKVMVSGIQSLKHTHLNM